MILWKETFSGTVERRMETYHIDKCKVDEHASGDEEKPTIHRGHGAKEDTKHHSSRAEDA